MIRGPLKKGSTPMRGFTTEQVAKLNAAINEALQHLPETATDDEVIAWLREHHSWIWERHHLKLLAEGALAELIEEVLKWMWMCASATEADPDLIAYEDRPGRFLYALRASATDAEKLASRRLAAKRRQEALADRELVREIGRTGIRGDAAQTGQRERPQ
jgi:hypothetical protein